MLTPAVTFDGVLRQQRVSRGRPFVIAIARSGKGAADCGEGRNRLEGQSRDLGVGPFPRPAAVERQSESLLHGPRVTAVPVGNPR